VEHSKRSGLDTFDDMALDACDTAPEGVVLTKRKAEGKSNSIEDVLIRKEDLEFLKKLGEGTRFESTKSKPLREIW
jgi:hypothetical protein